MPASKIFRAVAISASVATAFAMTACGNQQAGSSSEDQITIGAILPLTGNAAAFGKLMKNGAELAVEKLNAAGGLEGKKIVVKYEDSAGDSKTAVSEMKKIVGSDDVPLVLGSLTDNVLAITPIAEQKKVVLINGGGQGAELAGASDFLFNDIPLANTELGAMARFAAQNVGKTAVVLHSTDEYGVGGDKIWNSEYKAAGGSVLGTESYATGSTDYRAQLSKLKQYDADVFYFTAYGRDAQLVLKQAKEVGLGGTRVGTTVTVSAGTQAIPEAVGLTHTSLRFDPSGTFVDDYKSAYGTDPDLYAANYYNAVMIFADAYKHAKDKGWGEDGASIAKAIRAIKTFNTVNGELVFKDDGSALSSMDVAVIQPGGKDKVIDQIEIADLQ